MAFGLVGLAALLSFAALAWTVRRQEMRLRALEARPAEGEETRRLLFDRRHDICLRFDALWLCWSRCVAPGDAEIEAAAAAAEEAKRLFPATLAAELDEVARLLALIARQRAWQREAVRGGRHGERVALLDQQEQAEQSLKARLGGLRMLLAQATRPDGA